MSLPAAQGVSCPNGGGGEPRLSESLPRAEGQRPGSLLMDVLGGDGPAEAPVTFGEIEVLKACSGAPGVCGELQGRAGSSDWLPVGKGAGPQPGRLSWTVFGNCPCVVCPGRSGVAR